MLFNIYSINNIPENSEKGAYYDIGYKTGEMAAKILTGEADISTMPILLPAAVWVTEAMSLVSAKGYWVQA